MQMCPQMRFCGRSSFRRAPPDNDWSCCLRRSTPTLRRRLILSADFERCVFHIFRLIVYIFFTPSSVFELRLIIFFASSFTFFFMFSQFFIFWFAQYCLSKIPLWCMGESDKAPTNKIYLRASSEQRQQTRSCHESERLV